MSEENKEVTEEKGSEVTLESLSQALEEQSKANADLIKAMKSENAVVVERLTQQIEDRDGDIQNLTNLLGGLANENNDGSEDEDTEITQDKVKQIIEDTKKKDVEDADKASKAHWKEYGETAIELLDDEGPDGKPLSSDAKEGIRKLMVDHGGDMTKNPTKDAFRDFKKAMKIYFGTDKEHGFKGGSVAGTGGGGSDSKSSGKKTYTLSAEAKKQLKELGETEEWGLEMMAKRGKEREEAMI